MREHALVPFGAHTLPYLIAQSKKKVSHACLVTCTFGLDILHISLAVAFLRWQVICLYRNIMAHAILELKHKLTLVLCSTLSLQFYFFQFVRLLPKMSSSKSTAFPYPADRLVLVEKKDKNKAQDVDNDDAITVEASEGRLFHRQALLHSLRPRRPLSQVRNMNGRFSDCAWTQTQSLRRVFHARNGPSWTSMRLNNWGWSPQKSAWNARFL